MKKQKLIMEQLDTKILLLKKVENIVIPPSGWVYSIRQALGMSLRQLGKRMGITPQSVKEMEEREQNETISIKVLRQFGKSLNLKLIYGFIPLSGNLEDIIEQRAYELAMEIVNRTSISMKLEDQENNPARIQKAIKEKANEIKTEMPKYLWD
ncbi:MAG: mobile mystery protein A [Bacteroidales bacterium]|nr:mobile mystery protein A [Bacteroidales bacterium]